MAKAPERIVGSFVQPENASYVDLDETLSKIQGECGSGTGASGSLHAGLTKLDSDDEITETSKLLRGLKTLNILQYCPNSPMRLF